MYAIVESNKVKEVFKNPKPLVIEDITYPISIFGKWSVSELQGIGIYSIDFKSL